MGLYKTEAMKKEQQRRKLKGTCKQCGRTLQYSEFYTKKTGGEIYPVCKNCITQNMDVTKRTTFDWFLKEMDVPFIKNYWLALCKRLYMRDSERFSPKAVLGTYYRTMKMKDYSPFGYADSAKASYEYDKKNGFVSMLPPEKKKALEETMNDESAPQEAREEAAEILRSANKEYDADDKAENLDFINFDDTTVEMRKRQFSSPDERRRMQIQRKINEEYAKAVDNINAEISAQIIGNKKMVSSTIVSALQPEADVDAALQQEKSISDELTQDDIRMLSIKWGEDYRPSEWLRLEEMYRKYTSEFEMNVDREEVLKKMCKTSLKMDQALDEGNIQDYVKLQSAFDSLRKSGKFTEAQNKDKQEKYLDSIGELVAAVEKQGGIIPQFDYQFETTQDKVDFTLKDMQSYTYNLVRNEMGLGNLIETYIQKLDEQQAQTAPMSLGDGLITSREEEELRNDLLADNYMSDLERKTREEAERMLAKFEDLGD